MKRLLVVGLVALLVGGVVAAPVDAKKKRKKKAKPVPAELKLFLRRDACEGDAANPRLSIKDGDDGDGNNCGQLFSGAPNEVLIAAGETPDSVTWPLADGLPFTLHAGKEITGEITLNSFTAGDAPVGNGAGEVTLEVTLAGTTADEPTEIGVVEHQFMASPQEPTHTAEFSIEVPKELNKKVFTALELTTLIRGQTALYGSYELDDPASFISLSRLVMKKR